MRWLLSPSGLIGMWLARLLRVQLVDRGVALGAQAFSAVIPLMIVYGAVVPFATAHNFAEQLVKRLRLTGSSAQTVAQAVAPPSSVAGGVTVLSVVLVTFSLLSLARALQRLYELSYGLPAVGVRATRWHLLWLAMLPVYLTVRPWVTGIAGGWWHVSSSLALAAIAWLVTPYVLLSRRIAWLQLLPGAVITSAAMSVLGVASVIYLPHSVTVSASRFGAIGVAFALLSWLVLTGFVLVGSATAGAVVLELRDRTRSPAPATPARQS